MHTFLHGTKWALCLAGTLAFAAPATAATDNEVWNQGQAELQKNLPPGQTAAAYRKKLEELGYKVTATNYNNDDYLEYEVVKGDQTWEVQIDVDDDTRKATQVDIAMNVWKTDATERALQNSERIAGTAAGTAATDRAIRANRYSDRDRMRTDEMVKELEAMPVGRDKQFYKDTLRKNGYTVSRVTTDDEDELDIEAVKNARSLSLSIDFDEDTGKSEEIDASALWAESEATTKTREAQEMRKGSERMSEPERTSTMDRRTQTGTYEDR